MASHATTVHGNGHMHLSIAMYIATGWHPLPPRAREAAGPQPRVVGTTQRHARVKQGGRIDGGGAGGWVRGSTRWSGWLVHSAAVHVSLMGIIMPPITYLRHGRRSAWCRCRHAFLASPHLVGPPVAASSAGPKAGAALILGCGMRPCGQLAPATATATQREPMMRSMSCHVELAMPVAC